jgi:hypothetical protein
MTDLETPLVDPKKLNEKFQKVVDEIDSNWSEDTLEKINSKLKQVKDIFIYSFIFYSDF